MLEVRMSEYGAGLVKLKEASIQDAAARKEGQKALQAAHAELKGAALREQVSCLHVHGISAGGVELMYMTRPMMH